MAIGFDIVIPDTLLKKITDADTKLKQLGKTADDTQKAVNNAFKQMIDGNLDAFIKKLQLANTEMAKLGNAKIQTNATNTSKSIDEINKLITALEKLSTTQRKTSQGKKSSNSIIPIPKVDEWNNLQKSIQQSEKRIQELTRSTREYEATLKRIQSGKGGVLSTQDQQQYNANKVEIDELNKSIALQRQKQQEIVNQNKAIQEQIKLRESLKKYHLDQKSLPNQRSDNELKAMREYYKELEKTSAKKQKEWDKQLQTYTKKKEQEAKAAEKAEERKRKAEEKTRIAEEKKLKKTQLPDIIKPSNATIGYNPKSVNQLITAINKLKKAQNDLDITDRDYLAVKKAMNYEIEKHKKKLKELGINIDNIKQKSSNLMNISEQLTRRLALVFSVSQITGYVKKLASVRGEFELQQKSLAAIIQNKDKANEIFDKVTKLAVQSPFQLKELVTYTKQLAAYKIETGKLYDNIKMIADISAGVGVDMSRLVLAYGQVASANYLRGTELRQFSEAGVNILGGLADYFSELQGRVVGVAEVFDMVSRRMVKFSDVEEVLRRMTEAGGEFYNMQAIQAQTLKGQISNLKDSIEIMLNDIGKSQEGKLKGGVALVRDLVENWRAFASVLQDVSVALVIKGGVDLYKGFRVAKDDLDSFIEEAKGLPKVAASIKKMFFDIQKAIVAHPYIALAAAIAVVGKALWDWNKAVEAQNKVYKENSAALANEIRNVEKLKDKYEQFSDAIVKAENDMQKARDDNDQDAYNKAQNDANLARKEQLALLDQLKREYPEIYAGLNSEKVGTEELTAAIEEYNNAKRTQIALNEGKKASFWGGDSEGENINDAQSEINEYMSLLETAKGKIGQTLSRLEVNFYEGIINKEQYEEARKLLLDTEKAIIDGLPIDKIVKKQDAFEAYAKTLNMSFRKNFGDLAIAINDAKQQWKNGYGFLDFFGVEDSFDDIRDKWEDNIDIYKAEWYKLGEIDETTEAGKTAAKKYLDGMIAQLESKDKYVINAFKEWLKKTLGAKFLEPEDENGGEPQLEWVKRVKDDLADIQKQMPKNIEYLQSIFDGLDFTIELPENQENYEEYYKLVVQWVDKIRNAYDRALNDTDVLISEEETEALKMALGFAEQYLATVGGGKQKKEDEIDKTSEQIRVLKEMHKAYLDLNKTFDETTSKQGAIDKFGNAFKEAFGVDVSKWGFDFTTEEGVVAAFDKLIKSIPDQKKRVQAELAKGEFVMEYKLQLKTDQDKDLKNELQSYFDQYESMLELNKLGISGDAAYSLFGIESMDLDKLRSVVDQFKDQFTGTDREEEYKAFQDKLTEMEVKAQQERLKKYLQYSRDAISERAKLELGLIKDLGEIEKTFNYRRNELAEQYGIALNDIKIKEGDSAETTAKKLELQQKIVEVEEQEKAVIDGITQKNKEDLFNLDFEQFKSSETFAAIFNDLEKASDISLENIKKKLEGFVKTAKGLSIEDLSKYLELIQKVEDVQTNRDVEKNPFAAYKQAKNDIQTYKSSYNITGNVDPTTDIKNAEAQQSEYQTQIEALEKINTLLREGADTTQLVDEYNKTYNVDLEVNAKNINSQIEGLKLLKSGENDRIQAAKKVQTALQTQLTALSKQKQFIGQLQGAFNDLAGASVDVAKSAMELAGVDMSDTTEAFIDLGTSAVDTAFSMAQQIIDLMAINAGIQANTVAAQGFGAAMNMAMGIIGIIVMALQLIAKIFSAIVKAHDDKLQKQIERDAEAVELLQKRYEKLEEAIDNAMSFGEYQQAFDENKRNLEEQIRLTEDMIALEEDKKKTDEDAIKGYKDNIEEYNEQLQEMEEKRISDMGGFGSQEAIKDAAMDFIDAWAEAYNETGDGLDALRGKWDEYFDNLLKKQMMMKVANKYLESALKEIDKALEDDVLTGEEMENLERVKEESSTKLNNIMKQLAEQMGWEGGTGGGSELDGLSESIQGVTEVTAQALEAILNSMRFYVIDNNKQLIEIANTLLSWESPTSPILAELKAQTSYLSSIESLFNSVIDRSGSPAVRIR